MIEESAHVVIVGSGMGGGTLAWGLAQRGIDTLVIERGEVLPREPQNWSPEAVFLERRYKPDETWLDDDGNEFHPGVHYVVGGNTKVYGASLPRLRERDFAETAFPSGISPAWPFSYGDLEPYYGQAESLYRVHGTTGEDPSEPWRSSPFPYPPLPHEPYILETMARLESQGLHPSSTSMGIDLRPGGTCVRCQTCDGFPCRLGAKSDAETCALGPALAGGSVRLLTGARIRSLEVDASGRVTRLVGDVDGEPLVVEARSRGAVGGRRQLRRPPAGQPQRCDTRPGSRTRPASSVATTWSTTTRTSPRWTRGAATTSCSRRRWRSTTSTTTWVTATRAVPCS